jgi:hypothetical protein
MIQRSIEPGQVLPALSEQFEHVIAFHGQLSFARKLVKS